MHATLKAALLFDRSVGRLVGWSVGWKVGWLVGRLVGRLVSWLVGRLVGCSVAVGSEHATYGDRPCFLFNNSTILDLGWIVGLEGYIFK